MLVTRNFSEDSTLTLNDGVMSRQSSAKGQSTQSSASQHQRKDTKYSKSRSPIMQSLNPTQLQPPSSILKAEVRSGNTGAEQNSEQNSAASKAAGTTSSGDSTQWAF